MAKAIGIDLGTTYSCVGVLNKDQVDILINEQGNKTTPSCVAYTSQTRYIGTPAVQQEHRNAANTIYAIKRLMGQKFNDPEVQTDIQDLTYKVINEDGNPEVQVSYLGRRKTFTPQEISSTIIQKMINLASHHLKGEKIKQAVITVPAYFTFAQRQATVEAGQIAGLEVVHIINEPTAAAMAYAYNRKENKTILIFDLGGGTLDVSIVEIKSKEKQIICNIKATHGNTHLGGIDFDKKMVDYFMKSFVKKNPMENPTKDQLQDMKVLLRHECEVVKRTLSVSTSCNIYIRKFSPDGTDLEDSITRVKFEELCSDLFKKCFEPVEKALKIGRMKRDMIEDIVLVGGSTRMPKIREMVQNYFDGKYPAHDINPDEAVAQGAAIKAALLSDSEKEVKDIVLMDVLPNSVGIAIYGTEMHTIIPQNTTIPVTIKKMYTTEVDEQESVLIQICEGEDMTVRSNKVLGQFELFNIERAAQGKPDIEITFAVDSNGILKVSAEDYSTRALASKVIHTIDYTNSLTNNQIKNKQRENEMFLKQDKDYAKRKELRDYLEEYFEEGLKTIQKAGEWSIKVNLVRFIKASLEWLNKHATASIRDLENLKEEAEEKLEQYIKND